MTDEGTVGAPTCFFMTFSNSKLHSTLRRQRSERAFLFVPRVVRTMRMHLGLIASFSTQTESKKDSKDSDKIDFWNIYLSSLAGSRR
jgi:hypothetical protein